MTLLFRHLCSFLHFLFLSFCIHLVPTSCQFSLQGVSNMALPLPFTSTVWVRILSAPAWVSKLLTSDAASLLSRFLIHPVPGLLSLSYVLAYRGEWWCLCRSKGQVDVAAWGWRCPESNQLQWILQQDGLEHCESTCPQTSFKKHTIVSHDPSVQNHE